MDFRNLLEGECGDANPLVRAVSHVTQDRGFRDEGIGVGFDLQNSGNHPEVQMAQEFLAEIHDPRLTSAPTTFRMDSLLHEMQAIEQRQQVPPVLGPPVAELAALEGQQWADDFHQQWSAYDKSEQPIGKERADRQLTHLEKEYQIDPWNIEPITSSYTSPLLPSSNVWLPPNIQLPAFDQFAPVSEGPANQAEEFWAKDFPLEQISEQVSTEIVKETEETIEGNAEQEEMWKRLQDEWEKLSEEANPWLSEYSDSYDPYKEYSFHEQNSLRNHPDPFEEGKRKKEEGDLCSAVLLFEAAVQENQDHMEAWLYLGTSQAENEQDPSAIAALKRCLALDPENQTALMALAISYTNESYQRQACETLKEWLKCNPKYNHLVPNTTPSKEELMKTRTSSLITEKYLDEVQGMYIAAARLNPGDTLDPDVQSGLGVLYNLSNQYNKAVDCFKAALQARPKDALLWNRLGATLANGSHSVDAVDAYNNALQLFPGFIRCRYNLGVTCINLEAYSEAAEHLVTALNIQASVRGPQGMSMKPAMSESIWSTLRMVTSLMERRDLSEAVDQRNLDVLKKELHIE